MFSHMPYFLHFNWAHTVEIVDRKFYSESRATSLRIVPDTTYRLYYVMQQVDALEWGVSHVMKQEKIAGESRENLLSCKNRQKC